jgi:hypothetical protein
MVSVGLRYGGGSVIGTTKALRALRSYTKDKVRDHLRMFKDCRAAHNFLQIYAGK